MKALKTNRGSRIKAVRDKAMPIIMGMNVEWFSASFQGRGEIPKLTELIDYTAGFPVPSWPPILHGTTSEGDVDLDKPFQGKFLPLVHTTSYLHTVYSHSMFRQILIAALFGTNSLTATKSKAMKKTCGELWKVSKTTPGAIAFVSVLVRPYSHIIN